MGSVTPACTAAAARISADSFKVVAPSSNRATPVGVASCEVASGSKVVVALAASWLCAMPVAKLLL